MFKKIALVFPFLAALMLSGCSQETGGDSVQPLAFETVGKSQQSGITVARQAVVKDAPTWQSLWAEHTGNVEPPPPRPEIDFSKKTVVGVFLGQRPDLCYAVAIEAVEAIANRKIMVKYRETGPLPGMACAQAISYPAHLVTIDRSNLPVEFTALK